MRRCSIFSNHYRRARLMSYSWDQASLIPVFALLFSTHHKMRTLHISFLGEEKWNRARGIQFSLFQIKKFLFESSDLKLRKKKINQAFSSWAYEIQYFLNKPYPTGIWKQTRIPTGNIQTGWGKEGSGQQKQSENYLTLLENEKKKRYQNLITAQW